tara:strand:+ start:327 stop:716 length:390 start_codon:yes stop_codon:yes gene_type:complete
MILELVKLKIVQFFLKINIKIGQRLAFYHAKYSATEEVEEAIKDQNFDLRGMKDRMKAVILHDQDIIDKRWAICEGCEFLTKNNRCEKCKCFMKVKTRIATAACPVGKWDKEYDFIKGKEINGSQPTVK